MFHITDELRRARGRILDGFGLGPRETPSPVVLERPAFRLRAYGSGNGPAVLVVPAPIKRYYIWDLEPEVSAVRRLAEGGLRVFLVEWLPGGPDEGLDAYAGRHLDEALAAMGGAPPVLAGHSLGGTLSAVFAARHPERVGGLVLLEAPLRFGPHAGAMAPVMAAAPHASRVRALFGEAPGSFITAVSAAAAPDSFIWNVWADRMASLPDPAARRRHARVLRWTLDEFPMPGALFEDVAERLYREDRFYGGTLRVGGRGVGAADLRGPVLAVADPVSRVVPPDSALIEVEAFRRPESLVLSYEGDRGVALRHVGVLVGESAHKLLWPRIVAWVRERDVG